jgi:hypothetical protein
MLTIGLWGYVKPKLSLNKLHYKNLNVPIIEPLITGERRDSKYLYYLEFDDAVENWH